MCKYVCLGPQWVQVITVIFGRTEILAILLRLEKAGSSKLPFLLVPASLCTGQNRGAGGEQRPLSEASGKNESKPERALVPAVSASCARRRAGGGEHRSAGFLGCCPGAALPLLLRELPATTGLRVRPHGLRTPLSADPNAGWGPPRTCRPSDKHTGPLNAV